jgi:hypothetical protein
MKKNSLIGLMLGAVGALTLPLQAAIPINVMILDGEPARSYHNWQETTPYLQRVLRDAGIFKVAVVTCPPRRGDYATFKQDWSKYQVIVLNYDAPGDRWPDTLKASFGEYVRNGGGLVPTTLPTTPCEGKGVLDAIEFGRFSRCPALQLFRGLR